MRRFMLAATCVLVGTLTAAGDDNPADLNAAFAAGSKWKGIVREKKGMTELTADLVLVVSKRNGTAFEGSYENFSGKNVFAVEGTVEKGKVVFQFTKVEKGAGARNIVGVRVKGVLAADKKTGKTTLTAAYDWPDAQNPRVVAKGAITLTLVES